MFIVQYSMFNVHKHHQQHVVVHSFSLSKFYSIVIDASDIWAQALNMKPINSVQFNSWNFESFDINSITTLLIIHLNACNCLFYRCSKGKTFLFYLFFQFAERHWNNFGKMLIKIIIKFKEKRILILLTNVSSAQIRKFEIYSIFTCKDFDLSSKAMKTF